LGAPSPFWGGEAGSPSNTNSPRAEAYLRTKWNLDLCSHLTATDMAEFFFGGGGCAPSGEGSCVPPNTTWPRWRTTCMPSLILIRQTVWPQYTNVTDRQTDRKGQTDNGPIA